MISLYKSNASPGPTSAITAFKSDVQVTVVDINPRRIAAWKSSSLPIYEPGLLEIVHATRDGVHISNQGNATNVSVFVSGQLDSKDK